MTGTLINERPGGNAAPTASDRFSWRRVALVAGYYRIVTDRQLLIYLGMSALMAVLSLMPFPEAVQMAIFSIFWMALPVMFYVAPAVFASKGDGRPVGRMLPARTSERFIYLMLYLLVALPAATFVLPLLAEILYLRIPAVQHSGMMEIIHMQFNNPLLIKSLNLLGGVSAMLTCLYVVQRARSSRVVKGILAAFAVEFAMGIIGAFYGMAYVFRKGFEDGMAAGAGQCVEPPTVQELMEEMTQATPFVIIALTVIGAYMVLMFWLNYRIMKKRNL